MPRENVPTRLFARLAQPRSATKKVIVPQLPVPKKPFKFAGKTRLLARCQIHVKPDLSGMRAPLRAYGYGLAGALMVANNERLLPFRLALNPSASVCCRYPARWAPTARKPRLRIWNKVQIVTRSTDAVFFCQPLRVFIYKRLSIFSASRIQRT